MLYIDLNKCNTLIDVSANCSQDKFVKQTILEGRKFSFVVSLVPYATWLRIRNSLRTSWLRLLPREKPKVSPYSWGASLPIFSDINWRFEVKLTRKLSTYNVLRVWYVQWEAELKKVQKYIHSTTEDAGEITCVSVV